MAGLNNNTAEVPPACAAEINFSAMAAAQPRCGDTQAAMRSSSLQVVNQQVAGTSMWCYISTGKARPLVPACHTRQVFAAIHVMAHPGIRASRRLISHRFLWKAGRSILCRKLGIIHTTTTAYHPQSNGLVERAHHQLKEGLKTRLASHEWPAHLPWVLLDMRTSPKDDSAISSAELVYGAPLVLPGEFVDAAEPPAADFLEHVWPGPVSIPTRPIRRPPQETNQLLQQAKWVYSKRGGTLPPLTLPYAGPYAVAEAGEKTFEVLVGGQRQRVSVDRLKPLTGPAPVMVAPPAHRGRPPKERTAAVVATTRTYAEVVAGGGSL